MLTFKKEEIRGNKVVPKCGYKLKQKTQPSFYLEMKFRHLEMEFRKFYWSKYRCESRTVKKAECRRIDAFELWCWRRFLRVPWTAKRSNQSILKEISPEYSLEGLMLNLKLQYFGHLM